jgi:hypothetical protein
MCAEQGRGLGRVDEDRGELAGLVYSQRGV